MNQEPIMTAIEEKAILESKDTKEQISRAATKIFAFQGFDGASIREIADAAGVTKPVLYYYFKNKEDLYIWLIRDAYDFLLKHLKEIIDGEGDFHQKLKKLHQAYLDISSQYEDTTRLLFSAAFAPRRSAPAIDIMELERVHIDILKVFFEKGIESGAIQNISPEEAVYHFFGSLNVYIMYRLLQGRPYPENLAEKLNRYVLYGIGGRNS
ncbi:MAG: TetR/AcrR family transcriptional regulator [Candidatus Omnitrophota bacterium]